MTQPAWPERGVWVPTSLLTATDADGKLLPPTVRDTWMVLRALACGRDKLDITFETLEMLTSKTRSPILAHLAMLRDRYGLRYHTAGSSLLQVLTFGGSASSAILKSGQSQNQDLPDTESLSSSELKESSSICPIPKSGKILKSGLNGKAASKTDPRTSHPAIQACRELVSRYPDKSLYDRIIGALTESPDTARLADCRREWVERGYNPSSWKWATEWYVSGIPARQNGNHQTRHRTPTPVTRSAGLHGQDQAGHAAGSRYHVDPDLPEEPAR